MRRDRRAPRNSPTRDSMSLLFDERSDLQIKPTRSLGRLPCLKALPVRSMGDKLHGFNHRTINLTQEQRFIIRENVKDLKLTKAQASATETIGDRVPDNIELHPMPPEIANKVPQAKSHSFFVKDGDNAIVLVSPSDRRVADVIPEAPTK